VWPGTRRFGCVLVHGFTATPEEVRPLGDGLAARGFPCRAVRLPGHGTSIDDLARVGRAEWIATVERAVDVQASESGRVALAGVSLGALLAAEIAATHRAQVDALVLCAIPLAFADRRVPTLRWLAWLPGVRQRYAVLPKRTGGRDILDPEARARSHAYETMPLPALLELFRLRAVVRRHLHRITQPTLAMHGRHDHTAPVGNLELLRRRLRTPWLETQVFESSAHIITEDQERDAVAARAADFVGRVESKLATRDVR